MLKVEYYGVLPNASEYKIVHFDSREIFRSFGLLGQTMKIHSTQDHIKDQTFYVFQMQKSRLLSGEDGFLRMLCS